MYGKIFLLAIFFIFACGKDESQTGKTSPTLNSASRDFLGLWVGFYIEKKEASTKQKVSLQFLEDGKFSLTYPELKNSGITGKYHTNPDKLLFEIEKSSLPTFGLSGENKVMSYERFADKLLFSDEDAEYNLDYQGVKATLPLSTRSLAGSWYCPYQGLKWIIRLDEKGYEFSTFIQYQQYPPLKAKGLFDQPKDLSKEVEIIFTSQGTARKIKMIFTTELADKATAFYYVLSSLDQPSAQYQCERI